MKNNYRSPANVFASLLILYTLSGCMNMRVVAKYDSPNPVPHKVTRWNYAWGLVQPKDVKTDERLCLSICEVNVKSNLGYILISAATLGIAVPMSVEYKCCPYSPEPGNFNDND